MSLQNRRYAAARPPSLAEGWSLERLTPVSRLFGAPPGTHASLSSTKLRKTRWNMTF